MRQPLPDAEYLPRATVAERVARGRDLRDQIAVERHGTWQPPGDRRDPITILEDQAAVRSPDLVPIRHARMAASPSAFFRGAAAIMASDLAGTATSGLTSQLCGDAHLMNFGLFETPERRLIFGLNDFDETLPGPVEWDVKRLAASFEVATRDLGFDAADRESVVLAGLRSYREALLGFAEQRDIDVWYASLEAEALGRKLRAEADPDAEREVKRQVHRALRRDHLKAFDKLIEREGSEVRFRSEPPLLVPVDEMLDEDQRARYVEVVRSALTQYRGNLQPHIRTLMERYRFAHMAHKVVGVGSVGTRAWAILLIGRDVGDPLLLQLKQADRSVLEPYAHATVYPEQGRRVVEGQRLMQMAGDAMLGWFSLIGLDGVGRDYYVRQLWDGKSSIDVSRLSPAGVRSYADACGWTLARGHARSGDRIAMAAYVGEDDRWDRAMHAFAVTYADLTEADHARLLEAIDTGRVRAEDPAGGGGQPR